MKTGESFRRRWLGLLATALAATLAASAHADGVWRVQNRLLGESKNADAPEYGEKAEDMSGIACAPGELPRLCLAVDDETQGAQIVILQQDLLIAGRFIRLIKDAHDEEALELDAEGVAYADGFFYVIGSHGRPRHETNADEALSNAKAAATRKLFRIRLSADMVNLETGVPKDDGALAIEKSAALATVLEQDPVIARFFDLPLKKHGLALEGVAVRGDNLYAGLRSPVLEDGNALIARVPLATLFDGVPGAATVFRLSLGEDAHGDPRGIRDITVAGDAFLLLAGPEQDPKKHGAGDFAIYAWNEGDAVKRLDLPSFGKQTKPEALVVLDRDADTAHALLLSDGPKEGEPTPINIPLN